MAAVTIYDMVILQDYFSKKKEPTVRQKAAAEKIDEVLTKMIEELQLLGPISAREQ